MKKWSAGVVLAVAGLALAGCGSNAQGSTDLAGGALHDRLPASVKEAGTLVVGGSAVIPPYLYKQGNRDTGLEMDMMRGLARELGVKLKFVDTEFDSLIPGLQAQKLDVAMGDFTDTKDRQQAVDFVDYTRSFQALLVAKGNPKGLTSPDDLCGTTVAAAVGSLSEQLAVQQDQKCKASGKPGVDVLHMQDASSTLDQLKTKRADASIIDYVIGRYISKTGGYTQTVGRPFYPQFHGAAVRKGNTQLLDALKAGFAKMIKDGTYGKVLRKWHLQQMAMKAPKVDAATS